MIVVDASVFNKLFLAEPDRPLAVALFEHCLSTGVEFLAPNILAYEAMSAAIRFGVPLADVFQLLTLQRQAGLFLVEPSVTALSIAERIATTGHEKSGYPHLYDSIYQAVAIERSATFVTADSRHYAKARDFGHICLLSGWTP